MDSVPKTYLAELVAARTEVTLSAALIREIDARAEREAKELLKDRALRNELTTLAIEAIRAAWRSLRQMNEGLVPEPTDQHLPSRSPKASPPSAGKSGPV